MQLLTDRHYSTPNAVRTFETALASEAAAATSRESNQTHHQRLRKDAPLRLQEFKKLRRKKSLEDGANK